MNRKIKIGIIGLGGIATRSHIPALATIQNVEIVAGAEIDSYQAKRTQERFGIPNVYPNYQEMLDKESLEAVYICLPNTLHFEATTAALMQGLHVYCEKPMGLSSLEAEELSSKAEQLGLILMPGYHLRYHSNFLRARALVDGRRLGKILQIQGSAMYSGPYRGWDPKSDWHLNPRSGGPLYDWGSHLLDLLLFITGLDIEMISAFSQKTLPGFPLKDSIVACFQAKGEIVGTLNLSWGARGNLIMLQIHGTAGSLLVTDDYYEHRTPMGGGLNKIGTLIDNTWKILVQKVRPILVKKNTENLYVKAAQNFIDAIQDTDNLRANKWDAVKVLAVLEAIGCSMETGRAINFLNETLKEELEKA